MRKKLITLLLAVSIAATFVSCRMSTSQLEKEVRELFNEKNDGTGVKATKVTLIKKDDNNYTGTIILTGDGETEEFEINVVYDGRIFQYEIPDLN